MPIRGRVNEAATKVNLKDPFMQLIKANNEITRNRQLDTQRAMKEAQFAEQMGLNRDKFAEQQAQNAFDQNIANQRLGLAQQRLGLARAAGGQKLTPYQKLQLALDKEKAFKEKGYGKYYSDPNKRRSGSKNGINNALLNSYLNTLEDPTDKAGFLKNYASGLSSGASPYEALGTTARKIDPGGWFFDPSYDY